MLHCAENHETRLSSASSAGKAGFCVSAQDLIDALCVRKGSKARCQTPAETANCAGTGAPYTVGCGTYQGVAWHTPCAVWRVKRPYCGIGHQTAHRRTLAPMPSAAIRAQASALAGALAGALASIVGAPTESVRRSPTRARRVKRRYAARLAAGDVATQTQARNGERAIEHRRAADARTLASAPTIGADAIRRLHGESTPGPAPRTASADYSAVDMAESAILRVRASKRGAWIDAGGWDGAPLTELARYARTHWVRELARTVTAQMEAARQISAGSYRAPVVMTDDSRETHWKNVSWQNVSEYRPNAADTRLTGELDTDAKAWHRPIDSANAVAMAVAVFEANTATPDPETIAREISARAAETARETTRIEAIRGRARARKGAPKVRTKVVYGRAKDGRPSSTVI